MSFYTWFYKTFEPFVSWLYRIDAHGVENIPDGGDRCATWRKRSCSRRL